MALAARPGDPALYLATLDGTVRRLTEPEGEADLVEEPVLDLRAVVRSGESEQGLVDLVFSPDGGHLLVSYTAADGALIVESFPFDGEPVGPDAGARILRIPQIRANHNGGGLEFGPEGSLWLAMGDGGSDDGPSVAESLAASQDTDSLLGAMLRVNPELDEGGYAIPPDNPFVGRPGLDEIWLYGLRNPFRPSFDGDGTLWIPDVGAADREEIDRLPGPDVGRGANLGWGLMEGTLPVLDAEPPPGHLPPVYEYPHDDGRCAIVGGVRVEGDRYPDLTGRYLFSDFCGGGLLSLIEREDGDLVEGEFDVQVDGVDRLSSVVAVEQPDGRSVFVVDLNGEVYRLDGA